MRGAAETGCAVEQLSRLRFRQRGESATVFAGTSVLTDIMVGNAGDDGDRLDILDRIVGHVLLNILVDRMGAGCADNEGVSIGSAFATKSAVMLPPAPGLFSTMNCWPYSSESFCATRRPRISVGSGRRANGTTNLTGRSARRRP